MERKELSEKWTFHCMQRPGTAKAIRSDNYEENLKEIGSFSSAEEFWGIYSILKRPSALQLNTYYMMFRHHIKPTWEDPSNEKGGKWSVRFRKGVADRLWEKLLLAIIGNQFELTDEICGCFLNVRHNEDIISVWTKTAGDSAIVLSVK